jgi:F0F1-type ATP synthase membrane subunit b/b'
MDSENRLRGRSFLLKPIFWVAFIIFVLAAMFLYGMSLVKDNTLLAQALRDLAAAHTEIETLKHSNSQISTDLSKQTEKLQSANQQLAEAASRLTEQERTLAERSQQLEQNEKDLGQYREQLADRDRRLADLSQRVSTLHPYGKGQGILTVYNKCQCSNLRVWIDGQFGGEASQPYSTATCGAIGAMTAIMMAGNHRITAIDSRGRRWEVDVAIQEDTCLAQGLTAR